MRKYKDKVRRDQTGRSATHSMAAFPVYTAEHRGRCGKGCASWPRSSPAPTCGVRRNGAAPSRPALRLWAGTVSEQFPKSAA